MAQDGGDEAAPVAALHAETLVAEHVRHQLRIDLGNVLDAETLLPGLERQRVAWQRRRNNREMFGEQRDQLVELEHRSGPTVGDQQRRRVRLLARHMEVVQVDAADRHRELPEAVEPGFPGAPVEAYAPIIGERLAHTPRWFPSTTARAAAHRASVCARAVRADRRCPHPGCCSVNGLGTGVLIQVHLARFDAAIG